MVEEKAMATELTIFLLMNFVREKLRKKCNNINENVGTTLSADKRLCHYI